MSEVKRYEPASGHDSVMRKVEWMQETENGGWVQRSDFDALRAENEAARGTAEYWKTEHLAGNLVIDQLRADYSEACDDAMAVARKLRAAEAELAALKAVQPVAGERAERAAKALLADNQRTVPAPPLLAARHPMDVRQPVADEREAFEVEIPEISATFDGLYLIPMAPLKAGEHLMTIAQHLRIEKQLRAALSAPAAGHKPTAYLIEGCGTVSLQYNERPAWADGDPTLTVTPLYEGAGQDVGALVDALELASQAMKAAHDSLFTQCLSNPIKNAWGKPVNTTAVNELQSVASKVDKTLAAHKAGGSHDS